MSMPIRPTAPVFVPTSGKIADRHERRDAAKDLSAAFDAQDLGAAKKAFVDLVRHAPEGATWNADSALANMGKALKEGDMAVAKSSFDEIKSKLQAARPVRTPPGTDPTTMATPSSTGGVAGTQVNVAV